MNRRIDLWKLPLKDDLKDSLFCGETGDRFRVRFWEQSTTFFEGVIDEVKRLDPFGRSLEFRGSVVDQLGRVVGSFSGLIDYQADKGHLEVERKDWKIRTFIP